MKSKKILLVISSLQKGGAERVMSILANYWADLGVDVTLMTLDESKLVDAYPLHDRINRESLSLSPDFNARFMFFLTIRRILGIRKLIMELRPDAVLAFMDTVNVLTILSSMGTGVRCVVSERTNPIKRRLSVFWSFARWCSYRKASVVVAQTKKVGDWLAKKTNSRIQVIPNPVRPMEAPVSFNKEFEFIAVGRLNREKGFDLLIRAFSQVIVHFPKWKLAIIGNGPDRKELEDLADSLKLDSNICFAGQVDNVDDWLGKAKIAVQPSHYEGFPNALLEAMALGMPVIASDAAGEMLIRNEVNGLLVPVNEVEPLAKAMVRLGQDLKLCDLLGCAAKKVTREFNLKEVMARWNEVLFHMPSNGNF